MANSRWGRGYVRGGLHLGVRCHGVLLNSDYRPLARPVRACRLGEEHLPLS